MQAYIKHKGKSRQPMTWPRTEPGACQVRSKSGNNWVATFGFNNQGNRIDNPQNAILERCVPILLHNHLQWLCTWISNMTYAAELKILQQSPSNYVYPNYIYHTTAPRNYR